MGGAVLRYAILRLEEEHRVVRDARRSLLKEKDDPLYPNHVTDLLKATMKQLGEIEAALRVLYPFDLEVRVRPPLYDASDRLIDFGPPEKVRQSAP
jgi:hypothetical protein